MQMFKCRICSESYMGTVKPSHCPFCGASENYIGLTENWQETECVEISDSSKSDLQHALMIENNSALFYTCSYEVSMNAELVAMFKALARMEDEHVSVIRGLLCIPEPQEKEDNRGRCHAMAQLNIRDALEREKSAIDFYTLAAQRATEERIKEVFTAFAEIEAAHIELIKNAENKFVPQII
ncbi:MAG: ferritin [Rubrobacteridae bacterium]|nr:ferritin [Rubrobacteridae bacterium]